MMWSNLSTHMGMSGLGKVPAIPAKPDEPGAFFSMIPNLANELSTNPAYLRCPEGTKMGTETVGNGFDYFCYTPEEMQQRSEQEAISYRRRRQQGQMHLIIVGAATLGLLVYAPGLWKATAIIPGVMLLLTFG